MLLGRTYALGASPGCGWGSIPRPAELSGEARRVRRAFLIFCFAILPGFAAGADIAQKSAEACLNTQSETQNIRQELIDIGWQQIPAEKLLGQDILAISARMLGSRLGYGEAPKARWTAEWQLVQDNAKGTRRLTYTPDAPTQRFFLRHPDGAGLVEVTIQSLPKFASVICEITVSEALANESLSIVATQQLTANDPPIVFSRDQKLSEEPNSKRVGAIYYNPKRIPDLIDTSFPFVGTIRVSNSLRR